MKPENMKGLKIVLGAVIATALAFFAAIWGVFAFFMWIFSYHSPEAQNIYLIMSLFIVTIFIIFLCTFIIIDKLNHKEIK